MRLAIFALLLVGCSVSVPSSGGVSLPADFPTDFPTPPNAKLLSAFGPLPFVPQEARGFSAQWSSTLSRAELETFYSAPHPPWHPQSSPIAAPSTGPIPISLPTIFLLVRESDGMHATVNVGMSNIIDKGTLVQATIIPAPPSPSPSSR